MARRPFSPAPYPSGSHPARPTGLEFGRRMTGAVVGGSLLAAGLACVTTRDGDGAALSSSAPAVTLQVQPGSTLVAVGESTRFTTVLPAGGKALWSVVPAAAGSIDADGLFSPSGSLGQCTVVATWSQDSRVTGGAGVTVVAAPLPATTSPDLAQAAGAEQSGGGGAISNAPVVGEGLASATASVTSGGVTLEVRHGFYPNMAAVTP